MRRVKLPETQTCVQANTRTESPPRHTHKHIYIYIYIYIYICVYICHPLCTYTYVCCSAPWAFASLHRESSVSSAMKSSRSALMMFQSLHRESSDLNAKKRTCAKFLRSRGDLGTSITQGDIILTKSLKVRSYSSP